MSQELENGFEAKEPTGIWPTFVNHLSTRTGLSQCWVQFLMLLLGSLSAFLVSEFFRSVSWDSAVLLFRVATVVSALGALVILLPSVGRRIVVSLVILFHLGGILTAVTSVTPAPWVSIQVWTTVYRPYLYFLWLNNAYHFYSPQPGPANLMWFCIEYDPDPDGTQNFRWVLVPDLDEEARPVNPDGSHVFSGTEYTRRLSLAEYAGNGGIVPWNIYQLLGQRLQAGQIDGIGLLDPHKLAYDKQYREPDSRSKRWIQTYVRHVANTYKHHHKPDLPVKSVKFYRVIHQILEPDQLNAGMNPNESDLYWPFYCGKFDKDGNFTDDCVKIWIDSAGRYQTELRDPYLYWLIPYDRLAHHGQGGQLEKADSNTRREKIDNAGKEVKP